MWLTFHPDGRLAGIGRNDDQAPAGASIIDVPPHAQRAIYWAAERGKVTLQSGTVYVGNQPLPAFDTRPDITYVQMLQGINGLSIPEGAKEMFRLLADLLLEHDKVEVR